MISLDNIHPFTQFQDNAKIFADKIRDTKQPIVLTVNGEAALVVHEASAFQALLDQMRSLEDEVQSLKRQSLRDDIQVGLEQADRGEFSSLSIDDIKAQGRRLLENSPHQPHE